MRIADDIQRERLIWPVRWPPDPWLGPILDRHLREIRHRIGRWWLRWLAPLSGTGSLRCPGGRQATRSQRCHTRQAKLQHLPARGQTRAVPSWSIHMWGESSSNNVAENRRRTAGIPHQSKRVTTLSQYPMSACRPFPAFCSCFRLLSRTRLPASTDGSWMRETEHQSLARQWRLPVTAARSQRTLRGASDGRRFRRCRPTSSSRFPVDRSPHRSG